MNIPRELLTLPNLLTSFRFVCAPVLLGLAWQGYATAFLLLLAAAFLSDVLDGMAARLTGQVTQLGALLDSWADVITYFTITLAAWWLWPDILRREAFSVAIVIASYALPAIAGIIKFHALTSYHTWAVKLAAASIGLTLYILVLGGPAWPFQIAAVICAAAAIEEISITLISPQMQTDVSTIWEALRNLRAQDKSLG